MSNPVLPDGIALSTRGLSRTFRTYQKQPGFWGSLEGFYKRKFEDRVALAATDLTIPSGRIVGLVGANGAGKTTLLKILSGLIYPSSGQAQVLGFTPWERNNAYLRQMSILLGQKNQLWWDISPMDSFRLLADIYDLPKITALGRAEDLARMLDCHHVLKIQLRRLSLGERMKMELIGALLHQPRILFLDEPTIGLDIVAQATIRKFLSAYVADKAPTVILTSHYMDDIASLASQLLLISKGNLVYNGTVEDFTRKSLAKQKIAFTLSEGIPSPWTLSQTVFPTGTQTFQLEAPENEIPALMQAITQRPGLCDLRILEVDFEDVIHHFLTESQGQAQQ